MGPWDELDRPSERGRRLTDPKSAKGLYAS